MTAGVAAPAYAGIPVTHRDDASAVAFVTGHEDPAKDGDGARLQALARFPGTLVFYMGIKEPAADRRAADRAGRDAASPPPWWRAARCPASAPSPRRSGASPPRPRGRIGRHRSRWSARSPRGASGSPGSSGRPLHGQKVAVTRARAQASELLAPASRAGGGARRGCRPSGSSRARLRGGAPDGRGPPHLRPRLSDQRERRRPVVRGDGGAGWDARALANASVAAIGAGTEAALPRMV